MTDRQARRVLLIGWDAADWQIIDPLLEQGKMPALRRLIDTGVRGRISTLRPVLSPMLWNSVATGKHADRHGIFGFVEPRPDGTGIRPVTSTSRQCKAIWNILSQNQMNSNVVGWFASAPAEPIRGCVVSDAYGTLATQPPDKRQADSDIIHPPSLRDPLLDLVVDPSRLDAQSILPFVPHGREIDQSSDDRLAKLARLIAKMSTVHAAACHLIQTQPADLTAVYYDAIDHFGHTFMPYHPPAMQGVSEADARLYGECVTACYRFHDMMLEAMLAYAGSDTTVILVSDHGFHSGAGRPGLKGYENPVSWHRPFGIAVAAGPGIQPGSNVYGASLLDVTPTILHLLGLPIGADMDGRVWSEILADPRQPDRVLSWESIDGDDGQHPEEARADPGVEASAVRQLVDLGYIEDPGEDAHKAIERTTREARHNLATSLTYGPRCAEAVPIWRELIDTAEPDVRDGLMISLAYCYVRMNEPDQCQGVLAELGEVASMLPFVLLLQADLHLSRREGEQALDCLTKAEEHGADKTHIQGHVGRAYILLERWDDAERAFRRALEVSADENAIAFNGLARIMIARGRYEQAVDFAFRSIALISAFPKAHYHLGWALKELGQTPEAIVSLESAIRLAPKGDLPEAHRLLAALYRAENPDSEMAWKHELAASRRAEDVDLGM
ncbi:alkaline phosphatase family protein [Mucisphaera sp.]|uniref:alkaline phosphatase family protein n=1 Tax=Mucisphaera sp. TaxID=2913024 RepID=UPI003D119CC9